ncbi:MAG: hypothetical protein IT426_13285 [Pirellulales bacterium]|nr:hypothetical protein [Pirellulales bacterium]
MKSNRRSFLLAASAGLLAGTAEGAFGQIPANDEANPAPGVGNPAAGASEVRSVAIVWKDDVEGGEVELAHAALESLDGKTAKPSGDFRLESGSRRLLIHLGDAQTGLGAYAACVTVHFRLRNAPPETAPRGFSFFLRDVAPETPLLVRGLNVAAVPADDARSYDAIDAAIRAKRLRSERDAIDAEPEETYENACLHTRSMRCPTWLGVGRDMRIFRVMPSDVDGYWGQIEPFDFDRARGVDLAEPNVPVQFRFVLGRGAACSVNIRRNLEEGALPIVRSVQRDGDVEYRLTIFATLEKEPLTTENVRGTHWTAALAHTRGAMLTDREKELFENQLRLPEVENREQELICWVHVEAVNTGAVPQYAYLQAGSETRRRKFGKGNRLAPDGKVVCVNRLDGRPMPQEEMAVLLPPGGKLTFEMLYPHRPLPRERAAALAGQSFDAHLQACRAFWRRKLEQGAKITLPEPAVDERVRAGLLHLDIATLGMTRSGPLLPTVGRYSPIGSESAPIVQFYDALGYHELAERSIQFFLDRQRADGFIETFTRYQLETGPVLWTIGEHFRYTRDVPWARRILPNVLKACNYLLAWRRRNLREDLRGKGYGLLEGKVADPNDFFHSFMLNAVTYLGLKRVVEMYAEIDPPAIAEVRDELAQYLADIRRAYAENVVKSPVVPLRDGSWIPSFSPWAEYRGPVSLYAEGGNWFSHGMFASRDSLIGALYLGIGEVLDPNEQLAEWLLYAHQELMTLRNAGFSQPYYCRHDWLHLRRGEVKQYLKTYYNQFASLQDRETYSFWEHYSGISQHKTHEEGWFLMQTRWMLWDEDFDAGALRLLSMIPRAWMEAGKEIKLEKCKSYFGEFSLRVRSRAPDGRVEAEVQLHGPAERWPKTIVLRLPHPTGKRPREVRGGQFDARSECVAIIPAAASMRILLRYA